MLQHEFPVLYIAFTNMKVGFVSAAKMSTLWEEKPKGVIIFYEDGGPSICDELLPFFSGPPFDRGKKKTWSPLRLPKNNSGPPPQTDGH